MAADQSRPQPNKPTAGRQSWRDKNAATVARPKRTFHWLRQQKESPHRGRHRTKLIAAILLLAGLVGAYVVVLLFLPHNTPLVLIGVLDYADPLPPNAYMSEDFDRFESVFQPKQQFFGASKRVRVERLITSDRVGENFLAALRDKLNLQRPGGPGRDVLLVYLSAHGILDANGRPALVLATDQQISPWHPQLVKDKHDPPVVALEDVLQSIKAVAEAKHASAVVFLDSSRVVRNFRLGVVDEPFVAELEEVVERTRGDNLFVINSTSAGERGWTVPEEKRSAFAYHLARGLNGQADHDDDGRIKLTELVAYLKGAVSSEVRLRHRASQTPRFFGSQQSADQLELAWSQDEEDAGLPDERVAAQPAVAWDDVSALWERHRKLKRQWQDVASAATGRWRERSGVAIRNVALYRGSDVLGWEAFQQGLLQLEALNSAGAYAPYRSRAKTLLADLNTLAAQLEREAERARLPTAISLRQTPTDADVRSVVEDYLTKPALDQPAQEALKRAIAEHPEQVAKSAWDWWIEQSSLPDAAGTLKKTLKLFESSGEQVPPLEIAFLRLLQPAPAGHAPDAVFANQGSILRSALATRDLAETAASGTDDLRAIYAIQGLVEQADNARRNAEDELFLNPARLQAPDGPRGQTEESYSQAIRYAAELGDAIDIRNKAWQELPYFGQWLLARAEVEQFQRSNQARGAGSDETRQQQASKWLVSWQQAVADADLLGEAIESLQAELVARSNDAMKSDKWAIWPNLEESLTKIKTTSDRLHASLGELEGAYYEAARECSSRPPTSAENLRDIEDLLATPLVSGSKERGALRSILLAGRPVRIAVDTNHQPSTVTNAAQSDTPPGLELFHIDRSEVSVERPRLSALLRQRLNQAFDELRQFQQKYQDLAPDRMALARAESAIRSHAALWSLAPAYQDQWEPLSGIGNELDEFDRHSFVVWQASRVLKDFWGSGEAHQPPYFERLAGLCLDEARNIWPGEKGPAFAAVERKHQELGQLARSWKPSIPDRRVPNQTAKGFEWQTKATLASPAGIPPGRGVLAAYAPAPGGSAEVELRVDGAAGWQPWLPLPLGTTGGIEQLALRVPDRADLASSEPWRAQVFYRGHLRSAPFRLTRLEPGRRIEFTPSAPRDPRILVLADQRDAGSASFILDCSNSMLRENGARIRAAKDALQQVLAELAETGNYRVSLWMYGHRLAYDERQKKVVTVCEFLESQRKNIQNLPSEWCRPGVNKLSLDVAQEWPPNNKVQFFNNRAFQQLVNTRIAVAEPMGLTPLYLAIVRAAGEDSSLEKDINPRRLVVLTDGENMTWSDEKVKDKTPSDVVGAIADSSSAGSSRIQLHLVAFGEARSGRAELQSKILEPLKQSNHYYEAGSNARALIEKIRLALGLRDYQVFDSNGKLHGKTRVGKQVEIQDWDLARDYRVNIDSLKLERRLKLEGGEAVDLQLLTPTSGQPELIFPPYLQKNPKFVRPLATAGSDRPGEAQFVVGFGQSSAGGAKLFRVGFQNVNQTRFTSRPVETWVEITPVGGPAGSSQEPYVFYDLQFEAGHSVPVLECRALEWPADATQARIRVFFKMRETPATHEPRISAIRRDGEFAVSLPTGRSVKVSVQAQPLEDRDGTRLVVTERVTNTADLYQVKVDTERKPASIARQFSHGEGEHEVQHTFVFPGRRQDEVLEETLYLTTRGDLERDAYRAETADPIQLLQ